MFSIYSIKLQMGHCRADSSSRGGISSLSLGTPYSMSFKTVEALVTLNPDLLFFLESFQDIDIEPR